MNMNTPRYFGTAVVGILLISLAAALAQPAKVTPVRLDPNPGLPVGQGPLLIPPPVCPSPRKLIQPPDSRLSRNG